MTGYFLKPCNSCRYIKVEGDLSNYATKADKKNKQELIHHLFPKKKLTYVT